MALTPEGAALTEQYQAASVAFRARILNALLRLGPMFDLRDIDASWARLGPALMTLTEMGRDGSAALAASYYRGFRAAEGVTGPAPLVRLSGDWIRAATVAFRVTGPVHAKQLVKQNRTDALQQAFVTLSGEVQRHVLDGGREMILKSIAEEVPKPGVRYGWARVTSGKPCAFCAMLASRGPVYFSRSSGGFKSHGHCVCHPEPVLRKGGEWPGRARDFQDLWVKSTRDTQGKDSIRAFRRAYESETTAS